MEMAHASHTPAHESTAAAAPFRAWRGSQFIVARGPTRATIETRWVDRQAGPLSGRQWYHQNRVGRQASVLPATRWPPVYGHGQL